MKKIIITESQAKFLKQYLNEERDLRLYSFDWDDNILNMPTEIYLKDNMGNVVGMSTHEFAEYRHLIGKEPFKYKGKMVVGYDEDPYRDFKDPNAFIRDAKIAIENEDFAPSIGKFIEALVYANPLSINTARGHDPKVLKKGLRFFIDKVITEDEKEEMVENIKDAYQYEGNYPQDFLNKINNLNTNQLIDFYLDSRVKYYPVSSDKFGEKSGLPVTGGAANPEYAKQVALSHFLKTNFDDVKDLIKGGKYNKISLGFSDDDLKNVDAMVNFIDRELSKVYPEVHFVVYDTSEGGKKKIVIEKD
jgi:hypothetical protein